MTKIGLALAGSIGLTLGAVLLFGGDPPAEPPSEAGRVRGARVDPAEPTPSGDDVRGPEGALPGSLRDSTPDGDLAVDASGHLVPTPSALLLFDYFLSATGEEPDEALRARIQREIRRRVREPAASEAEALLGRYLAYREAARRLTTAGAVPDDLERRLQWIRELRRAHFGAAEADALFGEEERLAALALERRRVAGDASLTPEERERRLEALDARLPPEAREARRIARSAAESTREIEALRARGASDAEVWAARERRFGPEAADRLATLDARRADFARRVAAYRAARDALTADPAFVGLAADEREAQIEALRARHFPPDELARARALDGAPLPPSAEPGAPTADADAAVPAR